MLFREVADAGAFFVRYCWWFEEIAAAGASHWARMGTVWRGWQILLSPRVDGGESESLSAYHCGSSSFLSWWAQFVS